MACGYDAGVFLYGTDAVDPVSYTHLDVYKRQANLAGRGVLLYILIKPLLLRQGERHRNFVDGFWKRYFQFHRTDQKMCIRDSGWAVRLILL